MASIVEICGYQDYHRKAVGQNIKIPKAGLFFLTIKDAKTNVEQFVIYGHNLTPRHLDILWKFESKSIAQRFFDHYHPRVLPFGYRVAMRSFYFMVETAIEHGVIEAESTLNDYERGVDQNPKETEPEELLSVTETQHEELGQLLLHNIYLEPDDIKRSAVISKVTKKMIRISKKMVVLYYLVDQPWMQEQALG